MPFGIISFNLIAIFLLFSAFLVFFSWRKEKGLFLRDFTLFLFGIAGASTCWAIASWFTLINPRMAGYFHPLATLIGGIGFLYFCHLALTFVVPERVKNTLTPLIFLFLIIQPILWLNPPTPSISEEGIILWNIAFLPGFALALSGILLAGLPLAIFLYLGIKSTERFVRWRSFLIVFGITIYMGGGLAHNLVASVKQYLISDLFTLLGVIILLFAVYLKRFLKQKIT